MVCGFGAEFLHGATDEVSCTGGDGVFGETRCRLRPMFDGIDAVFGVDICAESGRVGAWPISPRE